MKHITNSSKPSAIAIAILISSFSLSGCSSLGAGYPGQKNASAGATTYQGLRDENRIRRHIYAGVGIGPSWMQPDTSRAAFSNVNDRVEAGGQVTLGMDLSRQLALEFHSADLGSAGVLGC